MDDMMARKGGASLGEGSFGQAERRAMEREFVDALIFMGDPSKNLRTVKRLQQGDASLQEAFEEFVRLVSPHRDVLAGGLDALLGALETVATAQMSGPEAMAALIGEPDLPEWAKGDLRAMTRGRD